MPLRAAKKLFSSKLKAGETKLEYKRRMSKNQSTTDSSPKFKIVVGVNFDCRSGRYDRELSVTPRSHKKAGWKTD